MLDIDIKKEIQGRFPLSENRNRRTITSVLFHKRVVTLSKEALPPIAKTSHRKIHLLPILLKKGVRFCQMYLSKSLSSISCPQQAPAVWGISFRYGTVRYFCKIPVYRYFSVRYYPCISSQDFLEIFHFSSVFFFGAISGQFREFPQFHTQVAQK